MPYSGMLWRLATQTPSKDGGELAEPPGASRAHGGPPHHQNQELSQPGPIPGARLAERTRSRKVIEPGTEDKNQEVLNRLLTTELTGGHITEAGRNYKRNRVARISEY